MILKLLVAEDYPDIRKDIVDTLNADDRFSVIAQTESVEETVEAFLRHREEIDALFLDLSLIGGTAFDVVQRLRETSVKIPPIIAITGQSKPEFNEMLVEYREIIEYLHKPVMSNWADKRDICLAKILAALYDQPLQGAPTNGIKRIGQTRIMVQQGNCTFVLPFDDVIAFEYSRSNGGTKILTETEREPIIDNRSLTEIERELPPGYFYRVSRHSIINPDKVNRLTGSKSDNDTYAIMSHAKGPAIFVPNRNRDGLEQAMLERK